jgi:DNA-binding SARP family transcriptional activator/tetratricopeptide (TPR) repeat protein
VRLGVLGPLLVLDDAGHHVPVPAARLRALLAALLLHAGTPMSAESLADLVWNGEPPDGAAITLRTYVRRLRTALGPNVAERIVTRPPGYLCRADEPEVDVLRFEALCRETDAAVRERRWPRAFEATEFAVALWRGAPLLDVPSRTLQHEFVPRFEQLRVQVLENQAVAALALGRAEQWVQPLRELVAAHPLRERLHGQLMLALARSGRRAEALDAYRRAHRTLADQLGIEPGPELRDLHQRILAGDEEQPAPDRGPGQAPTAAGQVTRPTARSDCVVPRQLPAAAGHFTGRQAELDTLVGLLASTDRAAETVVISAIDGMAGIGKTALAVHAAHRLADRFPDGQLFIDLRGYTKGYLPREPGRVLEALLRALGVPAQQIPEDTEERAALYRQGLVGTKTLVLLDNAASEAQVRLLLPGAPGCLVLVTSRKRLKGLDDARSLSLDLLPPGEAATLLRAVAGPDHIAADDPLLGEVAQMCGRLPLALRIAGALLRHRPAWSLEHLAALLRDQHRRVPTLSDGERDLATVFDLSYTGLDGRHRLLLRRLALVPGSDADAYAAAALLECDPQTATGLLEDLVDHNLLIEHVPGRYRLHDLIRAHTLAKHDPADERDAALDRLLHYYAHTAGNASVLIARYPRSAPDGQAPAHAPVLTGSDAATVWLRTERDNLEAAHAHAHVSALDGYAVALAAGLAEMLHIDGPLTRAVELHQAATAIAQRHGWPAAHATALTDLAVARRQAGDLSGSADAASRALEIFRAAGHRLGEANALLHMAGVRRLAGDLPGAGNALAQALEIFRAAGHRLGEANALLNLGDVRSLAGDLPGAGDALAQALEIFRAAGHRLGEANALLNLGDVRRLAGDLPGAGDAFAQALEIFRAVGHRLGEASALTTLGIVRRQTGDLPGAVDAVSRALEIYRAARSRGNEAWALNHYAAALAADDQPRALALYRQALAMNRELNKSDDEAVSLEGIGECLLAAGDTGEGTTHLRQALETFQRLGMRADAERVASHLTDLDLARIWDPRRDEWGKEPRR